MCDIASIPESCNEIDFLMVLNNKAFQVDDVFFSEKKNNIIMDGTFSKILYSSRHFTMNGIFFDFPIHHTKPVVLPDEESDAAAVTGSHPKRDLIYNPYHPQNISVLMDFCKIEEDLLNAYKQFFRTEKQAQCCMKTQFFNGYVRVRSVYDSLVPFTENQYVLKLSGIWETGSSYGLSYKIMYRVRSSHPTV